ncbi:hypothetical protein [Clostridium mediterraneense]|uniref:hypothetical protein n=1 Tax=Clostridium mediterraneense TaxID=1805472 RepID=UPI00082FE933|nr:hypothetical protein [Clostridium mediterraneense]
MGKEFKHIEENIKEKFHDASKAISEAIDEQEKLLKRDLNLEYNQEISEKREEKAPIIPESDLKKENVDIKVNKEDEKISNLKKLELELEMIAYKVGETGIN